MAEQKFVTMHTEQMQNYRSASSKELGLLYVQSQEQTKQAEAIQQTAKEHFYFSLIRDILDRYYDVGSLEEVWQIFGGYINTTFGIYTRKDGSGRPGCSVSTNGQKFKFTDLRAPAADPRQEKRLYLRRCSH